MVIGPDSDIQTAAPDPGNEFHSRADSLDGSHAFLARLDPAHGSEALALGAMPIAARVAGGLLETALRAHVEVASERDGAAGQYGVEHLGLLRAQRVSRPVGLPEGAKDVGPLTATGSPPWSRSRLREQPCTLYVPRRPSNGDRPRGGRAGSALSRWGQRVEAARLGIGRRLATQPPTPTPTQSVCAGGRSGTVSPTNEAVLDEDARAGGVVPLDSQISSLYSLSMITASSGPFQ